MISQRNVMNLLISNASTDVDLVVNTALTAGDLTEGQVAVTTPSGKVVDTSRQDAGGVTWDALKIAAVENSNLRISDTIYYSQIVSKKAAVYAAATQQIDYIGYNGSSGNIQAIDANDYQIEIELIEDLKQFGNKRMMKYGVYRSNSTGVVSSDVCIGLTGSLVKNFSREPKEWIQFDAITSATVTVGNCFDNNATVDNGSAQISVATNLQYGGVPAVVGDYVRLGTAAGAVGATAQGSATYEIISISGLNVVLDRPVEVASGTYTAAGNMAEVIPAATGDAASWGIKLTGLAFTYIPGQIKYQVLRWDLFLKDMGTTTITNNQAPNKGVGTYAEVADIEWFLWGNETDAIRWDAPPPVIRQDVDSTTTGYDLITLRWYDNSTEPAIGHDAKSYKELIVASNEANDDDTTNNIHYALKTTFGIT